MRQMRPRLPKTAHTSRPWRIPVTHGFRLEDVWALSTPGGPDDFLGWCGSFPRATRPEAPPAPFARSSRSAGSSGTARLGRLGRRRRLQGADASRSAAAGFREAPSGPVTDALPFDSLYLLDDEWAAETANRTVHGVLHLGWVPDGNGGYRGQMAVLVKPNGARGRLHGSDQAVPAPDRVPGDDATDRTGVGGWPLTRLDPGDFESPGMCLAT